MDDKEILEKLIELTKDGKIKWCEQEQDNDFDDSNIDFCAYLNQEYKIFYKSGPRWTALQFFNRCGNNTNNIHRHTDEQIKLIEELEKSIGSSMVKINEMEEIKDILNNL